MTQDVMHTPTLIPIYVSIRKNQLTSSLTQNIKKWNIVILLHSNESKAHHMKHVLKLATVNQQIGCAVQSQ